MTPNEINWPAALRAADSAEQSAAMQALRAVLQNGLRIALHGRGDVSEAHLEDFAQESLLRVLDRLDQFAGRSKFTTWAQAIALNTAFTELRRKRWHDVSLDALLANGDHLADPAMIADDVLGADVAVVIAEVIVEVEELMLEEIEFVEFEIAFVIVVKSAAN